jgi:hypothetical protein
MQTKVCRRKAGYTEGENGVNVIFEGKDLVIHSTTLTFKSVGNEADAGIMELEF